MQIDVLGFDLIKELLPIDSYFGPLLEFLAHEEPSSYSLSNGYLFLGDCLCILEGSMHHFLGKESHYFGHFDRDKTIALYEIGFFGLYLIVMSQSSLKDVMCVKQVKVR